MSVNILGTDYPIDRTTVLDLCSKEIIDIPENISLLTNLKKLRLLNNKIISIPESISSLTSLVVLFLSKNKIISIPESILSLQNLQKLFLSDNHIDDLSLVQSMSIRHKDFSNQTPEPYKILHLPSIII